MKTLSLVFLSFLIFALSHSHAEGLEPEDVARALGMDWWTVAIPNGKGNRILYFQIEYSNGQKIQTGSVTCPRVESVKVLCWSDPEGKLQVAAVSDSSAVKTSFERNPFADARVVTNPIKVGDMTSAGMILKKGSVEDSVLTEQKLEGGSFGLKVVVE